jgi:hypothetical protein
MSYEEEDTCLRAVGVVGKHLLELGIRPELDPFVRNGAEECGRHAAVQSQHLISLVSTLLNDYLL